MEFFDEDMIDVSGNCVCDSHCGADDYGCDDRETCDDYCSAD